MWRLSVADCPSRVYEMRHDSISPVVVVLLVGVGCLCGGSDQLSS